MEITTVRTGSTLVSSAVPNRGTRRSPIAYTGLFQRRSRRISVPVKCFYVSVAGHHVLIDAGWSADVAAHPVRHLGFGLWFASEPVMLEGESAAHQLENEPLDAILMTHLDSDHASGLKDFGSTPIYASAEEIEAARRHKMRYGRLAQGHGIHALELADDPLAPFGRSADFFGDGSVVAYLTPTHSAGSVVYEVSDDEGFALVVGDNGYMEESWEHGILPGPLYDAENMRKCLSWIKQRGEEHNCAGIYCAHDPVDR